MPASTRLKDYEKEVITRMNVIWSRLAEERSALMSEGTAIVHFKVLADGRVAEVKVVSNTGNQVLADVAILTVEHTSIPPIPPGTLAELPQGYMPGDCKFTVYPPR
ncbi:MAG TPA: energy transducer TonB [Chthoniobacterales bacterium]